MIAVVLVVARVRLYRDGIAAVFEAHPYVDVAGTAAELGEALATNATLAPDVLVVDASIPNSLDAIRVIASAHRHPAIAAVAIPDGPKESLRPPRWARPVMSLGTPRLQTSSRPWNTLRMARSSAHIVGTLFRRLAVLASQRIPEPPLERLTRREREVALLLAHDLSNREIARQLGIEIATVKHHVHNILEKLEVNRRRAAARIQPQAVLSDQS